MTAVEDTIRAAARNLTDSLEIPPVEFVYARADRAVAPINKKRRLPPKAIIGGCVALAIAVPSAAAIISGNFPDPIAGVNPDNKTQHLSTPLPTIPVGSLNVASGYVTLTTVTGPGGGTCYNLEMYAQTGGPVEEAVSSCGGRDISTTVSNLLGVSVIHTGDPDTSRVTIMDSAGTERIVNIRGSYGLAPELPAGDVSIRTQTADGKTINTHTVTITGGLPPVRH